MNRYIVLDTNCLLQSLSKRSAYYRVANADYIVTEDAHFNILKTIPFPKVTVKRLHEFCKELAINDGN